MDRDRTRETLGYDARWDRVLDLSLLDQQAESSEAAAHPEHARWAMWQAYATATHTRPMDDEVLSALLALDESEAARAGGFGHGIVLDIADRFALTPAQLDRIAAHPTPHGLSSRTAVSLAKKVAARR